MVMKPEQSWECFCVRNNEWGKGVSFLGYSINEDGNPFRPPVKAMEQALLPHQPRKNVFELLQTAVEMKLVDPFSDYTALLVCHITNWVVKQAAKDGRAMEVFENGITKKFLLSGFSEQLYTGRRQTKLLHLRMKQGRAVLRRGGDIQIIHEHGIQLAHRIGYGPP